MDISEIIQKQRTWLDKLQEISKKPILVKDIEGKTPEGEDFGSYKWLHYKDIWHEIKQPIYTRSILPNEILLDPDVKDWNVLKSGMGLIKSYCEREGIPLYLSYSGGNGIHGDIIFDSKSLMIDEDNFDKSKKYDIDLYKIIRNKLVDTIFAESGASRAALSIDSKKINFNKDRKGSMVREYGTLRPDGNYKTLITTIPETKPSVGQLPLVFPEKIEQWTIPQKYNKAINTRIKEEIEKSISYNNLNFESLDLSGNNIDKFPCIKTLFKNGTKPGNRYYATGSIALMARACGCSWTATKEFIQKFFSKCEITTDESRLRIDNTKPMFDSPDYHFSCRTMKEIFGKGICEFSKCPMCEKLEELKKEIDISTSEKVPQHIINKARQIQQEGNTIPFIMQTYNKLHVGDEITGKTVLAAIGTQSILNSNGIQPKVSAPTGKGKSHAASSILHLAPPEYIKETSLSGRALFHSIGLKPGTIIFSDDTEPDEALQEVIKRSSTNFQKTTNHEISVKDGSEWKTETKTIPPRIVWCLTSVMDNGSLEYLNRQLNLGVDESTDQDNKVMNFILEKAVNAELDFPTNDDVLVCREIIRDIKTKLFKVAIPYAKRIEWNDPENRRNLPQFLDLIKAFAVFDYIHRTKIDDITIEANEDDFYTALSMYSTRATNQRLKLNDTEILSLSKMERDKPYTDAQLQELLQKSHTAIRFLFHGRPGHIGGGLLDKVPALVYEPETEFLGESDIIGFNEFERELTITKKTKPKHVYILKADFKDLTNFGKIASLNPEKNT